jgi:arylsulfatase A-like enzyme
MTSTGTTPLSELDDDSVENVFIFVSDALRWDALPDRVDRMGKSFRMGANALCTPQSMPTIISGRYVPRHGVTWFHHSMNEAYDTMFDIESVDAGYIEEEWDRPLDTVLNHPPEQSIDDLEPPFVTLEHDHGGHVPFPEMDDFSPKETFKELSRDPQRLREQYEIGVSESVDRFERRLEQLREQGYLDDTLVMFMSDHGELLGEHGGFTGHMLPPAPELVYVPATFIHPSLESSTEEDLLIQHADLLPTIRDVLGEPKDQRQYDGQSLLDPITANRSIYTHGTVHPPQKYHDTWIDPAYEAPSVWTHQGGYVFAESSLPKRLLTAAYDSIISGYTAAYNDSRNTLETLATLTSHYAQSTHTYGTPLVGETEARAFCDNVNADRAESDREQLSEDTKQTLEDLGYV